MAAEKRLSERYAALEAERASKRIVVMDTLIAPKKPTRSWGGRASSAAHSFSSARRGAAATSSYAQQNNKIQSALNRARNDSQRARVALTHASGRFLPPGGGGGPSSSHAAFDPAAVPSGPAAGSNAAMPGFAVSARAPGERLPAPRVRRPANILPGAFRTPDSPPRERPRQVVAPAVPPPMRARPTIPRPEPRAPGEERFRIGSRPRELQTIHKPRVENFAASGSRKAVDFFGAAPPMASPRSAGMPAVAPAAGASRSPAPRVPSSGVKRPASVTVSSVATKRPRPNAPVQQPTSMPAYVGRAGPSPNRPPTASSSVLAPALASAPPPALSSSAPALRSSPGSRPMPRRPPPARPARTLEDILFSAKRKPPPPPRH